MITPRVSSSSTGRSISEDDGLQLSEENDFHCASGLVALSLAACHGILDDLYDQPEAEVVPAKGQLLIDATSWTDWYYVDLKQS